MKSSSNPVIETNFLHGTKLLRLPTLRGFTKGGLQQRSTNQHYCTGSVKVAMLVGRLPRPVMVAGETVSVVVLIVDTVPLP